MNQLPATYTATKEITDEQAEPIEYRAIGKGVCAVRGDDFPALICDCYPSTRLGITVAKACEMAEKIAAMLNGQAL